MKGFQLEAAKKSSAKTESGNTGDAIQRSVEARLGVTASAERQAKEENWQVEEKETAAIWFIGPNPFEEQTQQAGPPPKPLRVFLEAQIGDEWGPRQEPSAPRSYLRHRLVGLIQIPESSCPEIRVGFHPAIRAASRAHSASF